jgi:hypothetical protein
VAVVTYFDTHSHYPTAHSQARQSWRVLLLPYIEQRELHDDYHLDQPWDGPHNRTLADRMPRMYAFPDTFKEGRKVANYLAVVGPETIWPGDKPRSELPSDGTSSTILVVENHGLDVPWIEPRDLALADMSFELQHPHGISSRYKAPAVLMADSSVRTLGPRIDPRALRALLTADGGEELNDTGGQWRVIEDGRDREKR